MRFDPIYGRCAMHRYLFSERLSYFMAVYRIGNYADAARSIPISYQGLAKAIRSLEAELGVCLFKPAGNSRLESTEYADKLYQQTLDWAEDIRYLEFEFSRMLGNAKRTIRLGVATGVMGYLGLDAFSDFELDHPEFSLRVEECPDFIVDKGLAEGDYDFAITVAPYDKRFRTHTIDRIRGFVAVNKENPKSQLERFTPRDFQGEVVLGVGYQYKTFDRLSGILDEGDIAPLSWINSSELFWLYALAAENKGVCLLPAHVVSLLGQSDQVTAVPCEDFWEIGLSCLSSRKIDNDERILLAFLAKRCQKQRLRFGIDG